MFKEYLKQIGLGNLVAQIANYQLNDFVAKAFAAKFPELSAEKVKQLYVYDVPKMSPDGSCSITSEKADEPYSLAEAFGLVFDWEKLKDHPQTIRLWRLGKIVAAIYRETKVDWFGIYREIINTHGDDVLVKESYKGLFSRAEFPLTKEFAKKSNNSTVGLSGKAVVIQDVAAHAGAYYQCDGEVNSEFCLPIFSPFVISRSETTRDLKNNEISHFARNDKKKIQNDKVEVIGIIDAEAFPKNHYTDERLLQIAKVAYDLGQLNVGV